MDIDERAEQLAKINIFSTLRPAALAVLAQYAVEESFKSGEIIFRFGDQGAKLYLLLSGRVRIYREMQGMGEEALAILSAGDAFGEMALLDDSPRSADAKAHEICRVLSISQDAFDEVLLIHKDIAFEVLWSVVKMLIKRLRETNDKLAMLTFAAKFQ